MESGAVDIGYKIWGVDNVVYGPVELPTLVSWVKDERVAGSTWVFSEKEDAWRKASQVPELRMFFQAKPTPGSDATAAAPEAKVPVTLKPGALRRVKILAELTDPQLERFVHFMEVQPARQWTEIVKQGDHGDAMFLVLEGELRVRMMIAGKETTLVTLNAGEFFGEISLFDQGPRSADVVANMESVLLKISTTAFARLQLEAPNLATPFLLAICKSLTSRIRADNKRYRDSVTFARAVAK